MVSVPVWWYSCDIWLQAECSGKCKRFLQSAPFSLLFVTPKNGAIPARTYSIARFWSDSATIRSCPCWKAPFLTYSIPCASWLICTYQALSSVDRRPYTLFLCWSRLGFCGLTLMLVNTNSNKGTQRESIYTSNDYGTLKNSINEQSVKIHIHECFKNAKNPRTLAH